MQLLSDDVENEITLTAFRLLTLDLMSLYSTMNEGTIKVLGKSMNRIRKADSDMEQNNTSRCHDLTANVR